MRILLPRGRQHSRLRFLAALGCVVSLLVHSLLPQRSSPGTSHASSDPVFLQLNLRVVAGQRRRCPISPAEVLATQALWVAAPVSLLVGTASWGAGLPGLDAAALAMGLSLHLWVIPIAQAQASTLDDPREASSATALLCRLDGWVIAATGLALVALHWSQICGKGLPLVALKTTLAADAKANGSASWAGARGVDHYRVRSTTTDDEWVIEIKQPITIRIPREDVDFANIAMVLLNLGTGPDGRRYLDQSTIGDVFGVSRQTVNVRISTYDRSGRIVDVTSGRRHNAPRGPSAGEAGSVSILDDLSPTADDQLDLSVPNVPGGAARQEACGDGEYAPDYRSTEGQEITLAASFQPFLRAFESAFQRRSFHKFLILATGWILTTGRHTVTGVIRTVKGYEIKHFSLFHAFFSRAKWSFDTLWRRLFEMGLAFVPTGVKILLAGDDTLARKQGNHIRGGGMHHDPLLSRIKRVFLHFGHNWVVLSMVLRLPFIPGKGFAIPVLAWLYRPKKDCERLGVDYRTHTEMMREMVATVASWAPDRLFEFTGDSAYGCAEVVKALPANVECVGRLRMDAALYEPAPPREKGARGRPRKKGQRLPTPKMIAEDAQIPWTEIKAFLYGRRVTTTIKRIRALWYTTAGDRPLSIVIVRDPSGDRHDEAFFTTDLTLTPVQILERFALRWTLETLFENSKQCLGFEDPQNRTDLAVERTAPFALLLTGLVVLWFATNWRTAQRFLPEAGPWYTHKDEVGISFADMLAALRRMSQREMITAEADGQPLPPKLLGLVLHLLEVAT